MIHHGSCRTDFAELSLPSVRRHTPVRHKSCLWQGKGRRRRLSTEMKRSDERGYIGSAPVIGRHALVFGIGSFRCRRAVFILPSSPASRISAELGRLLAYMPRPLSGTPFDLHPTIELKVLRRPRFRIFCRSTHPYSSKSSWCRWLGCAFRVAVARKQLRICGRKHEPTPQPVPKEFQRLVNRSASRTTAE